MHVTVNGVRLYVDIEGAGLVPDGPRMRERPTLVLLHGGPSADHSIYKPAFSQLSDIAQIVYYDHRGCGRSEDGPRESWILAQWADDVRGLCEALGSEKPIVYGASFGGFVAQAYAIRHPTHAAKLILTSTAAHVDFPIMYAAFERLGGARARAVAEAYWSKPSAESRAAYSEVCLPLYRPRAAGAADWLSRMIVKNEMAIHFNGPGNEQGRMDFRQGLVRVECPVLILAGDRDPVMPIEFSETLIACLPRDLARLERFPDCGHGVVPDAPEKAFRLIREFILAG